MDPYPSRRRLLARRREVAQRRPAGGPFSLRRQLTQPAYAKGLGLDPTPTDAPAEHMTSECARAVISHREVRLPREIVDLILTFKPEESHAPTKAPWSKDWLSPGRPFVWHCPSYRILYHCCGGLGPYGLCTRFEKGMYHPGKLEKGPNVDHQYVRWTCCGATFDKHDLDAPVGCTPLDLTVRVTTVTTRAAPATESDSEETV